MRITRRIATATLGVFLLQLSLLGSGTLCPPTLDQRAKSLTPSHEMPMPGMSDTKTLTVARDADESGTPKDCDHHSTDDDCCRNPSARSTCSSMAMCTIAMTVPAIAVGSYASRMIPVELPEPALANSEWATAPEAPPPRA